MLLLTKSGKNNTAAFLVTTVCAMGQSAMWPSQSAISTELTPEAFKGANIRRSICHVKSRYWNRRPSFIFGGHTR